MSKDTIGEQKKKQKRKRSVVPGSAYQNHAAQESETYRNMDGMEEDQTKKTKKQ